MTGGGVSGGCLNTASMPNAVRRPCVNAGRAGSMPAG